MRREADRGTKTNKVELSNLPTNVLELYRNRSEVRGMSIQRCGI